MKIRFYSLLVTATTIVLLAFFTYDILYCEGSSLKRAGDHLKKLIKNLPPPSPADTSAAEDSDESRSRPYLRWG
jgi:hypothetical protein